MTYLGVLLLRVSKNIIHCRQMPSVDIFESSCGGGGGAAAAAAADAVLQHPKIFLTNTITPHKTTSSRKIWV